MSCPKIDPIQRAALKCSPLLYSPIAFVCPLENNYITYGTKEIFNPTFTHAVDHDGKLYVASLVGSIERQQQRQVAPCAPADHSLAGHSGLKMLSGGPVRVRNVG